MGLLRPSTWSVEGFAQATYDALNPVYGEGAPLEFVAEAVAPIVPVATAAVSATAAVTQGAYYDVGLAKAVDRAQDWVTADTTPAFEPEELAAIQDWAQPFIDWVTTDEPNPVFTEEQSSTIDDWLTPYAEAYTEWYETATPVERVVDVAQEIGTGLAEETSNIITEGIEATAVPITAIGETIVEPIASEAGDVLEGLILPAAIIGGAVLLLK